MKTEFYAIFDKRGFVRATKRQGKREGREVGMKIEVDIPDKAFDDGFLHASIAAPDDAFVLPQADARIADIEPIDEQQ